MELNNRNINTYITWHREETEDNHYIWFGTVKDITIFQIEDIWYEEDPLFRYKLSINLPHKTINKFSLLDEHNINQPLLIFNFESEGKCMDIADKYLFDWLDNFIN